VWIANILGGMVILFLGIIIRVFNVSGLIAGYNTAPAEERAKYDEEALTRFVGAMLIVASVVLLAGGLLPHVPGAPDYVAGVSWALFMAIVIGGVVYMNTGERGAPQLRQAPQTRPPPLHTPDTGPKRLLRQRSGARCRYP